MWLLAIKIPLMEVEKMGGSYAKKKKKKSSCGEKRVKKKRGN